MSVTREGYVSVFGGRYQIKPWWWIGAGWNLNEAFHPYAWPARTLFILFAIFLFAPVEAQ